MHQRSVGQSIASSRKRTRSPGGGPDRTSAYHALVYYRDYAPPPAGEQFNREWGLSGFGMIGDTPGGWSNEASKPSTTTFSIAQARPISSRCVKRPAPLALS